LYIDPLTAHHLVECLGKGCERDLGYLHMVSSTLEMRPYLKIGKNEWDVLDEEYARVEDELILKAPAVYSDDYFEYMQTVKTALFLKEWCDEMQEDYLLDKYKIRPGEIRAKIDRAEWLLYAAHELAKLLELHRLMTPLAKLRVRVKHGVKEELLPLLRLRGVGRVRARTLFDAGCESLGALKSFDTLKLASLVGKKLAVDLKSQVGVDVDPLTVEDFKIQQKGQTNLHSF
jgi:helicase